MIFTLSIKEREYLKIIENRYKNSKVKIQNFTDDEFSKYGNLIEVLCRYGVLRDENIDNANAYSCIGNFEEFYGLLAEQDKKYNTPFSNLTNIVSPKQEQECCELQNFIKEKLRATFFDKPSKEKEVQDNIERLFLGRGLKNGIDYGRETGAVKYSDKEFVPDFTVPKLNLCIEVKLLKDYKSKAVIDQINADIVAYGTKYDHIFFVIYDLGGIREEAVFKSDIEKARDGTKVIIVKH